MRRTVSKVVGVAGAVVLAAVLLGYGGPIWFELDLLAHFRLHLLLLAVVLAGLAVSLRNRGALWRSTAAALLAAAGLAPLWHGPPPPGPGMPVTVMTANLYLRNPVPERMRRALIDADADILVTAETTSAERNVGGLDAHYPYHVTYQTGGKDLRTALWSKFPISDDAMILSGRGAPAGAVARIETASGREITVVGLHLSHVAIGTQGQQIESFGKIAEALPRPLVVMGDFNATAWSHAVRRVEALTGTRRVGGVDRTWHGGYPTPFGDVPEPFGLPIDHILISPGIGVRSIETVEIPGSDHLAVRAVLTVPPEEGPFARAAPVISLARDGTGEGHAPRNSADGQGQ